MHAANTRSPNITRASFSVKLCFPLWVYSLNSVPQLLVNQSHAQVPHGFSNNESKSRLNENKGRIRFGLNRLLSLDNWAFGYVVVAAKAFEADDASFIMQFVEIGG